MSSEGEDRPAGRNFWCVSSMFCVSASALEIPLLDPYLKSVGSNFSRGANFAATGATATNSTAFSPFPLATQFYQFLEFKRHVLAVRAKSQGDFSTQTSLLRLPTPFLPLCRHSVRLRVLFMAEEWVLSLLCIQGLSHGVSRYDVSLDNINWLLWTDWLLAGSSSPSQNADESERLPLDEYFRKALYIIAIGGNDILLWTVTQQLPFEEVELLLTEISEEILRVVEVRISYPCCLPWLPCLLSPMHI